MLKIIALDDLREPPYALYVFGVETLDGDDTIYVRHNAVWRLRWTTAYDCWSPSLDTWDAGVGVSKEKRDWLDDVCKYLPGSWLIAASQSFAM